MLPLRFALMNNFFCYGLTERILWHVLKYRRVEPYGNLIGWTFFRRPTNKSIQILRTQVFENSQTTVENVHRCTRTSLSRELWKTVEKSGIHKTWNHSEYNSWFGFWEKKLWSAYTPLIIFFSSSFFLFCV